MGDLSRNFSRWEFACKCNCGSDTVDYGLICILEKVRQHFDRRVSVSSGHRCKAYNKKVGGGKVSMHLFGKAADISVAGVSPDEVANFLETKYPQHLGIGRYETFTHVDTRSIGVAKKYNPAPAPARWGKRG